MDLPNERVLVCGGREYTKRARVKEILDAISPKLIIHGNARGADKLAGEYGFLNKIPMEVYPADWDQHPKAAGPIRNRRMLNEGNPTMIVAFPGGDGTNDMVDLGRKAKVPITRIII